MHLTPARVALRAVLLAVGGAFMLWRAAEAHHAARTLAGAEAALASRLTLVWALVGALALVTAAGAALSLLPRRHRTSLGLREGRDPDPREGARLR